MKSAMTATETIATPAAQAASLPLVATGSYVMIWVKLTPVTKVAMTVTKQTATAATVSVALRTDRNRFNA